MCNLNCMGVTRAPHWNLNGMENRSWADVAPAGGVENGAAPRTAATARWLCDVFARMALRPAELPLGVVMAVVGAPIFLHMVVGRGIGGA